ncbi:disulfide bond formation protein DsbH [Aestuariibacter sp. AA17]|uniref:Disulfide bond formation protein DsbH n=1 Tax=Fluctibacter corallii TaxID=2984329 RepID=A0ABT3AB94_9ALTE|nr:disulfide bond formation protein DsbH [Aestuariibacter sp. AA17]MCV2885933.1 disulfide bond formation protein DsbH [Aestuariibacter sp. AA17]
MEIIRSKDFTGKTPWEAKNIANMNGITTRLHWTDKPYKWHINDGEEVFVVLDGTEHVAHPHGAARILVIEQEGSI